MRPEGDRTPGVLLVAEAGNQVRVARGTAGRAEGLQGLRVVLAAEFLESLGTVDRVQVRAGILAVSCS